MKSWRQHKCLHEASHAVATELLGGRVARVAVFDKPRSFQKMAIEGWSVQDLRRRVHPLGMASVIAAGLCVDLKRRGIDHPTADARQLHAVFKMSPKEIATLCCLVDAWLNSPVPRRCIKAIAAKLDQKSTLTGAEVRSIIQKETDTLPYKSKAQARAMHAKASRGEIPQSVVREFDAATNFKKLPARKAAKKRKGR